MLIMYRALPELASYLTVPLVLLHRPTSCKLYLSCCRASHHKYMHPKEVLVTDGLLNREMAASLASQKESQQEDLTVPQQLQPQGRQRR